MDGPRRQTRFADPDPPRPSAVRPAGRPRHRVPFALAVLAACSPACAPTKASTAPDLPAAPAALRYRSWDGERKNLGAYRGRWLLVHVLATWSDPALFEVPLLRDVRRRFGPDCLEVLTLVVDQAPLAAEVFRQTFELEHPVGRPETPQAVLGPDGPFGPITRYPTSLLLDPNGRVRARQEGTWTPEALVALLERVCAGFAEGREVEAGSGRR